MLKTVRALFIAAIGMAFTSVASAQVVDTGKLFFGAGVSSNEMSGTDSALGWQIFGGYQFGELAKNLRFDAEVGYMDSGDMERSGQPDQNANGLWAAGVGRFLLTPNIELLGRLGMDFGDDDGLLAGIGAGLALTKTIKLRFEFVKRDHVDSWQFNLVFNQ
jgi:opacity protein-like surface antigen